LYIPDLIIKLYVYMNYFPNDVQNGTRSSKMNGKDDEFEYYFLIICSYLNLGLLGLWCLPPYSTIFQLYRGGYLNFVKYQMIILRQIKKFTSCYNINILTEIILDKIYVIFMELSMHESDPSSSPL